MWVRRDTASRFDIGQVSDAKSNCDHRQARLSHLLCESSTWPNLIISDGKLVFDSVPKSRVSGILWPALADGDEARELAIQFQLDQSQWWPPERLLEMQMRQLQRLMQHAARTTPFYRRRLADYGKNNPKSLTSHDFRSLPLLTRDDLHRRKRALQSGQIPPGHGAPKSVYTAGSCGAPVEVLQTNVNAVIQDALDLRFHVWHGRDLSAKNLTFRAFSSASGLRRSDGWARGFRTGPSVQASIVRPPRTLLDVLIAEDPDYLQTLPYTLLELAKLSEETGYYPQKLREVRTFGEPLTPNVRRVCADIWNTPVVETYSAAEVGVIAHQCPQSENLHIQSESVFVEILDGTDQDCAIGQPGRVVVTDLHNFASPIIRYDTGDIAERGESCPCGRGLAVLNAVYGRTRNLVAHRNGDRALPEIDASEISAIAPVQQFQLHQGLLDQILVRLVVDHVLSKDQESRLENYFNDCFGDVYSYDFEYKDRIHRMPNGKYEYFSSDIH